MHNLRHGTYHFYKVELKPRQTVFEKLCATVDNFFICTQTLSPETPPKYFEPELTLHVHKSHDIPFSHEVAVSQELRGLLITSSIHSSAPHALEIDTSLQKTL